MQRNCMGRCRGITKELDILLSGSRKTTPTRAEKTQSRATIIDNEVNCESAKKHLYHDLIYCNGKREFNLPKAKTKAETMEQIHAEQIQ